MYNFNAKKVKNDLVQFIKRWFEINGEDCNSVIGISGGIDSSVVAALCVEALGKDRVIGVKMPNHIQDDIEYSNLLCEHLEIKNYTIDVGVAIDDLLNNIHYRATDINISEQTKINLPPRIRMATLYAVSQSCNGRVMNTSNLSESYVGYDTRYGDSVGDCSPLGRLTKTEIRLIAKELNLPDKLINKTPSDGLCGLTDEDRFGFTYEVLDKYIRNGIIDDVKAQSKIDEMHYKNLFKLSPMPVFEFV